jgi:nucleotide-binding universal stress UspA family protein
MGLKDLLVHVDNDPACTTRVDVAVALAATHGAHLTGLRVLGSPPLPSYVEVELPPSVREELRRRQEELARQAEERFHERARRRGISGEWRLERSGDIVGVMKLHARYADLTVVGQGIDLKDAPHDLAFLPEELALGVGRPVLVVPRYGTFETVGERVLVAWNGSREATRAVHDALPLLTRATKVTVLSIDPSDSGSRVPSADITLHLARHDVVAEAASTVGLDLAVGDVLLSRAADLGADLIVMGAYGHSRVREMVLGGATRHILQHMTVPVLMSH